MRRALVWGVPAMLFIAAGALHFLRAALYQQFVPPQFGHQAALVAISGAAEIAGGIGLLVPQTRRAAGIGLIALLIAVWPANIHMAFEAKHFAALAPAWALWARIPLQVVLIWWVERASR